MAVPGAEKRAGGMAADRAMVEIDGGKVDAGMTGACEHTGGFLSFKPSLHGDGGVNENPAGVGVLADEFFKGRSWIGPVGMGAFVELEAPSGFDQGIAKCADPE